MFEGSKTIRLYVIDDFQDNDFAVSVIRNEKEIMRPMLAKCFGRHKRLPVVKD